MKRMIKDNPFGSWLIKEKDRLLDKIRYHKRKPFIPALTELLGEGKVSIISSNCFAGRIMQDLKMEYNSPTLGLYFMYPDYIEFLKHLEHYLKNETDIRRAFEICSWR